MVESFGYCSRNVSGIVSLPGLGMLSDQGCPCPKVERDRGVPILGPSCRLAAGANADLLREGGPLLSPVLLCLRELGVGAAG